MNLYVIYGEDVPHTGPTPFKTYVVLAPAEPGARQMLPAGFRVDRIELTKQYPVVSTIPGIVGCVEGPARMVD